MPTVIPVKFKYAARDLWFDPGETGAQEGDHLICSTERGTEIGLATMDATEMDEAQRLSFRLVFFPFMFGIYPYTEVTKKQKDAMKAAEIDFKYQTIRKITYNCLMQLL